jgi:1-acyl-sn-glycerol-3-phosphate acyltransferase
MSAVADVLRTLLRVAVYPPLALTTFSDYLLSGSPASLPRRVKWLRRCALLHAKWLGMRVRVHGTVPTNGLVVSNHVSYLDILGLSIAGSFAFIAKKEVSRWPIFGAYARMGATIFVDREQRSAVGSVAEEMGNHLQEGVPLVLFAEGTSTGGDVVLPFRSSLFEPVVKLGCPVTACGLRYTMKDGRVAEEIAYWRDMSFTPHIFNLFRKTGFTLDVHFGPQRPRSTDRKTLARELQAEVCALAGVGRE